MIDDDGDSIDACGLDAHVHSRGKGREERKSREKEARRKRRGRASKSMQFTPSPRLYAPYSKHTDKSWSLCDRVTPQPPPKSRLVRPTRPAALPSTHLAASDSHKGIVLGSGDGCCVYPTFHPSETPPSLLHLLKHILLYSSIYFFHVLRVRATHLVFCGRIGIGERAVLPNKP